MAKTISIAQLGHGGASRAIRDAEHEPVLVSKENRPAAWIVSSEKLRQVVSARGSDTNDYDRAIELIAVELYRTDTLPLGRAAKLAGLSLAHFIELCGRLEVPVLWEPPDVGAEADAAEALLSPVEAML